jgi:hypothetical protein
MNAIKLFLLAMLLAASTNAMSATPRAYDFKPSTDSLLVASDGEVILTFLSKVSTKNTDLYLQGDDASILNNQTAVAGSQFSLGSFKAGTELAFTIFVKDDGFAYYTGEASKNPDEHVHAFYDVTSGQSLNIGFEDVYKACKNDALVFSLNNVTVGKSLVAAVPEPETYAMFFAGLLMLGQLKRRQK